MQPTIQESDRLPYGPLIFAFFIGVCVMCIRAGYAVIYPAFGADLQLTTSEATGAYAMSMPVYSLAVIGSGILLDRIGIRTTMKKIDTALWDERRNANEMQATIYWTPALWYQAGLQQLHWGALWYQWWTSGGEQGEEPPEDVKELYRALASITLVSPEDALMAGQKVRDMMYENVYYFIPTENIMQPLIYNARLGNVSESEDAFAIGVNFSAEQFYYKS